MHYELSKADIRDWRDGKFASNRDAYHQLFQAVRQKDKAIARRYDALTGSRWLETVAAIFHDGYFSKEDIGDFSVEARIKLERWSR